MKQTEFNASCPRCGGSFFCAANARGPCDCSALALSPALLAALRQQYSGCLCVGCLRELAAAATTTA